MKTFPSRASRLAVPAIAALFTVFFLNYVLPGMAADVHVPMLKSGTEVYSNVTVYSQTETELFISHSRGMGNVKIATLDDESLIALGMKTWAQQEAEKPTTIVVNQVKETVHQVKEKLENVKFSLPVAAREPGKTLPIDLQSQDGIVMASVAAAVVTVFYLFWCYCLRLICLNANSEPGFLVWLPVLQIFPMLRAAQMSGWFAMLPVISIGSLIVVFPLLQLGQIPPWLYALGGIPLLMVFVSLWWCLRIAQACGKGTMTGILLFLPITGFFAFLYLAFSRPQREEDEPKGPLKLDTLAKA